MDTKKMSNCNCNCNEDYLPPAYPQPDCGCDVPLPPPMPLPPIPGCGKPPVGCSNSTRNYHLPLWKASDVTSWLTQMNGAMVRIDEILHALALRTGINGMPDDVVNTVMKLSQDVEVMKCTLGDVTNKSANLELLMQNMNTQFGAMQTDISSMQLALTNLDTRIMTVDSANKQAMNNITLIKSDLNMLSDTVRNMRQNYEQYQLATNQTLAEHSVAIKELQDKQSTSTWSEEVLSLSSENFSTTDIKLSAGEGTQGDFAMNSSSELTGIALNVREITGGVSVVSLITPDNMLINCNSTSLHELNIDISVPSEQQISIANLLTNEEVVMVYFHTEPSSSNGMTSTNYVLPARVSVIEYKGLLKGFRIILNYNTGRYFNKFENTTLNITRFSTTFLCTTGV